MVEGNDPRLLVFGYKATGNEQAGGQTGLGCDDSSPGASNFQKCGEFKLVGPGQVQMKKGDHRVQVAGTRRREDHCRTLFSRRLNPCPEIL